MLFLPPWLLYGAFAAYLLAVLLDLCHLLLPARRLQGSAPRLTDSGRFFCYRQ